MDFLDTGTSSSVSKLTKLYIMFILMWQALFKVSDTGINVILAFFTRIIRLIFKRFSTDPGAQEFLDTVPKNVLQAKKFMGHTTDSFSKYATCPKCHSLYRLDLCVLKLPDRTTTSESCSFVKFPHHPHARQRKPCSIQLMKKVRTSAGTVSWYPRQMYCYQSIIASLKAFLQRPNFFEKSELWRSRNVASSVVYSDIYDGNVWKEFLNPGGIPFLSLPYNFALSINIDWFQPFKYSAYSAGAIYIAIQNLPRNIRYLTENVILVGVIPGPNEPKGDINSYLRPLVNELQELWAGVIMPTHTGVQVLVRAALLCVACDIPAARKVSGFVGHNAFHACSRCLKSFPTDSFGEKPDYTGSDRSNWPTRTIDAHRLHASRHKEAKTSSQKKLIEREHGCKYSVLLELPYFDVIRFTVVDPMHNLLLGTAKHVMSVWTTLGILEKSQFIKIQEKVDQFVTPSEVGRIPSKIASGFSGFTAEQWRNWCVIYSLCSLKGLVPHRDYGCWLLFVKAVNLLCQRSITIADLEKGDSLLVEFCSKFEELYGKDYFTINMHLHYHLKECISDFGPVYAFWLFSFERLNGVLGSYHTNCKDISLQLMRKFTTSSSYLNTDCWPSEYVEEFYPLVAHHTYSKGSLQLITFDQALSVACMQLDIIKPSPPIKEAAWEAHEREELKDIMASVVGHTDCNLLLLYYKCFALKIDKFVLGSQKSHHVTKSHVMACHPDYDNQLHLARIEYYCKLSFKSEGLNCSLHTEWIAYVTFYDEHMCKVWFGGPTQVWTRSMTCSRFIRLCSIKHRVGYCETEVDFGSHMGKQTVLVVSILTG